MLKTVTDLAKAHGEVGAAVFLMTLLSSLALFGDANANTWGGVVLGLVGVYVYSLLNPATTLVKVLVGGLVGCVVLCVLANAAVLGVSTTVAYWLTLVASAAVAASPLMK